MVRLPTHSNLGIQTWWRNFVADGLSTRPLNALDYEDYHKWENEQQRRLQEWGAVKKYGGAKYGECLFFEDERDATMFLLRWS